MKDYRMELYKAVKWQAQEYFEDHGMTMVELWKIVNYIRSSNDQTIDWCTFWRDTCLDDYKYDHEPHSWQKSEQCIVARKVNKHFNRKQAAEVFDKYMNGGR